MLCAVTSTPARGWRPDDSTFGARLALIRHACGWNIKEAALACGLPVQSWRNWENDQRMPHDLVKVCTAISQRTGVDIGWLAGMPDTGGVEFGPDQALSRENVAAELRCTRPLVHGTAGLWAVAA